jgi:hypothetical protein
MKKYRISIADLMAFILLVAVGFAALKNPTEPVASATFSLTMVMLLLALVGVGFRRGDKQLFWAGFATFGWGTLAFDLSTGALIPPRLFSSLLIAHLTRFMPISEPSNIQMGVSITGFASTVTGSFAGSNPFAFMPFFQIGHSIAVLMIALLGTMLVRIFARREDLQS